MMDEEDGGWVTLDRRKKSKSKPQNVLPQVEDQKSKSKNKKKSLGKNPDPYNPGQRFTPTGSDKDASSSTRSSSTSSTRGGPSQANSQQAANPIVTQVNTEKGGRQQQHQQKSSKSGNTQFQSSGRPPPAASNQSNSSAKVTPGTGNQSDKTNHTAKPGVSSIVTKASSPSYASAAVSNVTNKAASLPPGATVAGSTAVQPESNSKPVSYSTATAAKASVWGQPVNAPFIEKPMSYSFGAQPDAAIEEPKPISYSSVAQPDAAIEEPKPISSSSAAQPDAAIEEPKPVSSSSVTQPVGAEAKVMNYSSAAQPEEAKPFSYSAAASRSGSIGPESKPLSYSLVANSSLASSQVQSKSSVAIRSREDSGLAIAAADPVPTADEKSSSKTVAETKVDQMTSKDTAEIQDVNSSNLDDRQQVTDVASAIIPVSTSKNPDSEPETNKSADQKVSSSDKNSDARVDLNKNQVDKFVEEKQLVSNTDARDHSTDTNDSSSTIADTNDSTANDSIDHANDSTDHANGSTDCANESNDSANPSTDCTNESVDRSTDVNSKDDRATDLNDSSSSSKSGSQIKLKYNYREDQWSPINVEGKRMYDRQFLLLLQNDPLSLEKPQNLPRMDIIKDKSSSSTLGGMPPVATANKDWMPGFIKTVTQRGSMTKKQSRDGKRSVANPTKIIDMKIEKVELHQSENAWKPGMMAETPNGENDQGSVDVLIRKARGILNKLCPQKFDKLVEKFNDLQIDTEDKLRNCIELIFEKAVDEPGFSVAYARMCEVLQKKQVLVETLVHGPPGSPPKKQLLPVNFRKLLIARCQKEFERDYMEDYKAKHEADLLAAADDEAKINEINSDWEEKERKARRRSLGNIQFIGELYKLKMLTGRIMHECITKLLKTTDEESLESLCKLLATIGKDLEQETNERITTNVEEAKKNNMRPFDNYFVDIDRLSKTSSLPSRVRFMLQDVVDLRKNNWKPRRDVAGPKTIEQIHKEAEREKSQQQLLNDLMTPRGGRDREMSGGNGGRGGHANEARKRNSRGGPPSQMGQSSDDGWTSVQPSKASQKFDRIDTNKIANLAQSSARRVDPDNIQLGPGTRSTWGQGSGSQRISRTKEDPRPDTRNKFAMLNLNDSSNSSDQGPEEWQDYRRGGGGPSRSMGMPGRSSRGPSAEDDKVRVLEAVRQMNGPRERQHETLAGGPTASMGPQISGRPVPESISQVNEVLEQSKLLSGKPLNPSQVEKQTKLMLDELLYNKKIEDSVETVCKDFHATNMELFSETLMNGVIESSSADQKLVGNLIAELIKRKIILKKQFQTGLNAILGFAEDLLVDIPLLFDYFGEMIAPVLMTKALPIGFLASVPLSKESGLLGKYLAAVLHSLIQLVGEPSVVEMWNSSNVNLLDFVQKDQIHEFAKSKNMLFLLDTSASSSASILHQELINLLKTGEDTDKIIRWIEENVKDQKTEPTFIRLLTTAVAESSISGSSPSQFILNVDVLTNRKNLLRHYIDSKPEREKHALFALQHLMHRLEHPNRILHLIFECLYDEDIISEDSLYKWESCDDPAEHEGKGVAIQSTSKFFEWLRSAESEDESTQQNENKK